MLRKSLILLAILCTAPALWSQEKRGTLRYQYGAGPDSSITLANPDGNGNIPITGDWLGKIKVPLVAVRAGRLFDSKSGQLLTKQVLLVADERIAEVGPEDRVKIPPGAQVIDLSQATVLPGLVDNHTHVFPMGTSLVETTIYYRTLIALRIAQAELWGGFTTIRDMSNGGNATADMDLRNAIERGYFPGPRMQVSGLKIAPTDSQSPWPSDVDEHLPHPVLEEGSPWEARVAVRKMVHFGADWIKVQGDNVNNFHFVPPTDGKGWDLVMYPTFTLEELEAITNEAHRLGHKVACHAYGGEGLRNCLVAGVDSLEHGIVLNEVDVDIMVQKGIYLDPTIRDYATSKYPGNMRATGGKSSLMALQAKSFPLALSKGVKIVFGSGHPSEGLESAGTQAPEFEWLVKYGMTPAQAIQAATTVSAEMLGWQDRIGSIEKGKFADIIAVSGDPLKDITELERIKFVMKGGAVIRNDFIKYVSSNPNVPATTADRAGNK